MYCLPGLFMYAKSCYLKACFKIFYITYTYAYFRLLKHNPRTVALFMCVLIDSRSISRPWESPNARK